MGVSLDGAGGKAIEGSAKDAAPGPLVEFAVCVEVGPAILASREEIPVGSKRRRVPKLVGGGEGGDSHTPRKPTGLLDVRVRREARERGPHRH